MIHLREKRETMRFLKARPYLILLACLLIVTAWLRIANLGYSDYQGDEIKALATPLSGERLGEFLLEQRKGPVQFLLTYAIKLVHPSLANQFITRLPFALAGILAVILFYRLAALHYGRKIGLIAAFALSINGLFIGLARIVQYQTIVILFSILALYGFSLAIHSKRWRIAGIYTGFICWAIALLAHYDGIFIAPFAIYLLARWYTGETQPGMGKHWKQLIIPAALFVLILLGFFVPYALSVGETTLEYWWTRIGGDETQAGIPSSVFTFRLYNPLLAIYLYAVLVGLSLLRLRQTYPVWLWLAFPWLVLEVAISDPGTHIYTYLLPATILVAFGIEVCESLLSKVAGARIGKPAVAAGLAVAFIFLAAVGHFIFIDHTPEYPWEERRIIFWTVGAPDPAYRLWGFGFPYNRQWEEIGRYITSRENNGYYSTNENKSIAGYFIPYPFDINRSGFYIHILHPQSLRDRLADDKIRYWMKNHPPVETIETEGRTVAEIYAMPAGNIEEIRKQGY